MNILVSACLLGVCCRYDGKSVPNERVIALKDDFTLIPVCPEIFGGLPTPRPPAERTGNLVMTLEGNDVTDRYLRGAREVLRLAGVFECRIAVLKERSPACGCGKIYDGTFSGVRIPGYGVTAEWLRRAGLQLFCEDELEDCQKWIREQKEGTEC